MPGESDQTKWVGTWKVHPAVSDLQAIKLITASSINQVNQNCTVMKTFSSVVVDPGEIWVITNMVIANATSICDMTINSYINAGTREMAQFRSYEPGNIGSWNGLLVLEEGDLLRFRWYLGGATDDISARWSGYIIGVY